MPTWLYHLRTPHGTRPIQLNRPQRSRSYRDPHGVREDLARQLEVPIEQVGMVMHLGRIQRRDDPPTGVCHYCWRFRRGEPLRGTAYHQGVPGAGLEATLCDGCWVEEVATGQVWLPGPLSEELAGRR